MIGKDKGKRKKKKKREKRKKIFSISSLLMGPTYKLEGL